MKRALWILTAVVLAAAALVAFAIMLVPREALRARMGEQLAAWTGRDVSFAGAPEIDFFPRLTVTLNDVRVGGPAGMQGAEIVSMERLTGEVRLLPLIIGRVEIGSFSLLRPTFTLVSDEKGERNWVFDSGAAALQLAFSGDVPLGRFVVEDGRVVYESRGRKVSERLDSMNLDVAWPSVRQPLTILGSGLWRGEEIKLSGTAAAPFDFLNGDTTPLESHFDSAPVVVSFDGTASGVDSPRLEGALSANAPSLRRFAAWLGASVDEGTTLGPASLSGAATFGGNMLAVEGAALTLDGNSASGAVSVLLAERPEITGTLDFPALDLTPYFANFSSALAGADDWRKVGADSDWLGGLVTDIRLSAASVRVGALEFGKTAASVTLNDARMEIGVAGAAFSGGSVAGALVVTDIPNMPESNVEVQLHATDVDLASASPALGLPAGFSGTASAAIDVAGGGRDFDSLMTTLGGTATLSVHDGAVPLFGVAELAAATDTPAAEPVSATAVESLDLSLSFNAGTATLEQAKAVATDFTADATGRIGLVDGDLGVSGNVQPLSGGAPRAFEIEGTLARPVARALALAN